MPYEPPRPTGTPGIGNFGGTAFAKNELAWRMARWHSERALDAEIEAARERSKIETEAANKGRHRIARAAR